MKKDNKQSKSKQFLKNNIKLFVGMILGGLIFGTGVYAALKYQASDIAYKNDTSVEEALDELYQDSQKYKNCVNGTYHHDANSEIIIDIGFNPKKMVFWWDDKSGNYYVDSYNSDISTTTLYWVRLNGIVGGYNPSFTLDTKLHLIVENYSASYVNEYDIPWIACR